MLECKKPIIMPVNGYAMGLGATVALLADVVVAGRSAVFADSHVAMALGAGDGGQLIWPLLVWRQQGQDIFLDDARPGQRRRSRTDRFGELRG